MNTCEKRLSQDMQILTKKIKDKIEDIDAIILCGGYGRGEGAWIQSQSKEEVFPYNDYDVCVVTNSKVTSKFISELEKEIANEIGIKWIDIDIKTKKQLSDLKTTIKNVDLKYASKIIYGDSKILSIIPDLFQEEISYLDIETLYFTRLWPFMGSLSEAGFTAFNTEDARFFKNQIAKALLAVIDVLLIKHKKYVTSYRQRLASAIELYPEKEWLLSLGRWALNEKLYPSSDKMSRDEVIRLYSEVYTIFKKEMSIALSTYYLFGFNGVWSLDVNFIFMPYYFSRRIYHYIIKRSMLFERSLLIRRAQNYLFFAYNHGDINTALVKKAIRLIQKLDRNINNELSWNQARLKIAQIRNEG